MPFKKNNKHESTENKKQISVLAAKESEDYVDLKREINELRALVIEQAKFIKLQAEINYKHENLFA